MNDLTILQASTGLEKYANETISDAKGRGIVVGHDHRHNSHRFARLTASVFRRRGWKVYEFEGLVHTPMVVSLSLFLNLLFFLLKLTFSRLSLSLLLSDCQLPVVSPLLAHA